MGKSRNKVSTPNPGLKPLLQACQQGQRESQRELYKRFYSYSLSICLRYVPDRSQATEVLNDAFLKVFTGIAAFDTEKFALEPSFKGWLKQYLVRTAIDFYRANRKYWYTEEVEHHEAAIFTSGANALEELQYQDLLAMIGRLPPAYRAVFNLSALDGYSHEEIASQLHISVGASKSNLSKARAKLREMISFWDEQVCKNYLT